MSDRRLDDWLDAVGFEALDDVLPGDDPWAELDVAVTPLNDAQRAFLTGSLDPFDDRSVDATPIDDAALSDAEAAVIKFPRDPDDIEPF